MRGVHGDGAGEGAVEEGDGRGLRDGEAGLGVFDDVVAAQTGGGREGLFEGCAFVAAVAGGVGVSVGDGGV